MKFPFVSLAALAALSSAPSIPSVSVVPVGGHADVVVGIESPVEVQDFTLDAPHRVVVDLKGATLASPTPRYDRIDRGGVVNVRVSQYRANTVRLVIELDSARSYQVIHNATEVRISVEGGRTDFAAWHGKSGSTPVTQNAATDMTSVAGTPTEMPTGPPARVSYDASAASAAQQSTQPRITTNYQDADIHDVIAAFAIFAGRTIVIGKDVTGTVTAEIRNQPWDVALRAILQGQGLAASEDSSSGIMTVDSYANVQAKQALEPLVTRLIPINYAKADSLVPVITKLLARDCGSGGKSHRSRGCWRASWWERRAREWRGAVASVSRVARLLRTQRPTQSLSQRRHRVLAISFTTSRIWISGHRRSQSRRRLSSWIAQTSRV